ncbi:hypothetical protein O6H91_16G053100 [Diphasiastrum complanatum]|uniref:Uncharacterized protein n=2 Tax=Diphasiastrum complanatum TaxID=34168 RepID=A0ACC2BD96_DIPCM|nr:hypothetical protein O6H91_16G053100 [Diphasiastrum complanatum]KAJ7527409.1 hypothetical protein O6H91_16G053100 [Diphasiastrum complanatum]
MAPETPSTVPESPTFSSDNMKFRNRERTSARKHPDILRKKQEILQSRNSSVKSSSSSSKKEFPMVVRKDSTESSVGNAKSRRRAMEIGKASSRFYKVAGATALHENNARQRLQEATTNQYSSTRNPWNINLEEGDLGSKQLSSKSKAEKRRGYETVESGCRLASSNVSRMSEESSAASRMNWYIRSHEKSNEISWQSDPFNHASKPTAEEEKSAVDSEEGSQVWGAEEWQQRRKLASESCCLQREADKTVVIRKHDEGFLSGGSKIEQKLHYEAGSSHEDKIYSVVHDTHLHERHSGIRFRTAMDLGDADALKKLGSTHVDSFDSLVKGSTSTSEKAALNESYAPPDSQNCIITQDKASSRGFEESNSSLGSEDFASEGSLLEKLKLAAREKLFAIADWNFVNKEQLVIAKNGPADQPESADRLVVLRNWGSLKDAIIEPSGSACNNYRPIFEGKHTQDHCEAKENSKEVSSSLEKQESQDAFSKKYDYGANKRGFKEECERFRHQLKVLKDKAEGYRRDLPEKEASRQKNMLGDEIYASTIAAEDRRVHQVLDRIRSEKDSKNAAPKQQFLDRKRPEKNFKDAISKQEPASNTGDTPTVCDFAKWRVHQTKNRLARMGVGSQSEDSRQKSAKEWTFLENISDNQQEERNNGNLEDTFRDTKDQTFGVTIGRDGKSSLFGKTFSERGDKGVKEKHEGIPLFSNVSKEHTATADRSLSIPFGGQKPSFDLLACDATCPQTDDQHKTGQSDCKLSPEDEESVYNDDYIRHVKPCIASNLSVLGQVEELFNDMQEGKEYCVSDFSPSKPNEGMYQRGPNDEYCPGKTNMVGHIEEGKDKHLSKITNFNDFCKDAYSVEEKFAKGYSKNWSRLLKKLRRSPASLFVAEARSNDFDTSGKFEEPKTVGRVLATVLSKEQRVGFGESTSMQALHEQSISKKDRKSVSSATAHKLSSCGSQIVSRLGNDSSGSERLLISSTNSSKLSMRNKISVDINKENHSDVSGHIDNLQESNMQMYKKDTLWQKVFPGLPELAIREKSCYYESHLEAEPTRCFEQDYNIEDFENLQATWMGEGVIKSVDEHLQVIQKIQQHPFDINPISGHRWSNYEPNATQHEQFDNVAVHDKKLVSLCTFMGEVKTSMEWIKRFFEDNSCYQLRMNDLHKGLECLKNETNEKLVIMKTNIQEELQRKMHDLLKERVQTESKEEEQSLPNMLQACSSKIASVSRQVDSSILEIQLRFDEKLLGALTKIRADLHNDVENLEHGVLKDVENLREQTDSKFKSMLENSESSRRGEMEKVELLLEQKMEKWLSQKMGTLQIDKDSAISTLNNELGCLWAEVDGLSKGQKETISCVNQLTQASEKMKEETSHSQELAKYENAILRKELQGVKKQRGELKLEAIEIKNQGEKMEALQGSLVCLEREETNLMKQLEVVKKSLQHEVGTIKESVQRLDEKKVSSGVHFEAFLEVKEELKNLRATLEIDEAKGKALIMDKIETLSHLFLGSLEEVRTDVLNVKLHCQDKLEDFLKQLENLKREQAYASKSTTLLDDLLKRVSNLECTQKQWQVSDHEKSRIEKALVMTLYERDTAARAASEAVNSAAKAGEILEDALNSLSSEMVDARSKNAQFQENLASETEMVLAAIIEAKNLNHDLRELVTQNLFNIKSALASVESERTDAATAASKAVGFADEAEKALSDITNRVDSCKYLEKDFSRALGKVLEENQQQDNIKFEKLIASWERMMDKEVKNVQDLADEFEKEKKEVSHNVAQVSSLASRLEVIEEAQQEFHRHTQRTEKALAQLTRTIEQVCDGNNFSEKSVGKREDHELLQNEINKLDQKMEEVMKKVTDCSKFMQFQPGRFHSSQIEDASKDDDHSKLHLQNLEKKIEKATANHLGLADKVLHMRRRVHKLENVQISVARAVEDIRTSTGDLEKSAALWLPKYESGARMVKEVSDRIGMLEKSINTEDQTDEKNISNFHEDSGGMTDIWNQSKMEGIRKVCSVQGMDKSSSVVVSKHQISSALDAENFMKLEKRIEHVASATLANLRILDAKVEHYAAGVESALEGTAVAESKCSALGAELVRVFRILAASNKGNPGRWNDSIKPGEPDIATLSRRYHTTELSAVPNKFFPCDACTHCKGGVERRCTHTVARESKRQNGKGIK